MRPDAESGEPRWSGSGDERVTAVGRVLRRLHLVELPPLLPGALGRDDPGRPSPRSAPSWSPSWSASFLLPAPPSGQARDHRPLPLGGAPGSSPRPLLLKHRSMLDVLIYRDPHAAVSDQHGLSPPGEAPRPSPATSGKGDSGGPRGRARRAAARRPATRRRRRGRPRRSRTRSPGRRAGELVGDVGDVAEHGRSRGRSRPGRRAGGGARRRGRGPPTGRKVGESRRRSTATSKIRPRGQRTSFAWPGSVWKWRPRSVPLSEREWLCWTNSTSTPSSAQASRRKVSTMKPRSSPWTAGLEQDDAVELRLQPLRHQPRALPYCFS